MAVTFPVLVLEKDSGDMLRFDSLSEMQNYLERIDVENGEYLAWGSDARPVIMAVKEPAWLKLESSVADSDAGKLFEAVQRFGEKRGIRLEDIDRDTPPLVLYDKIVSQSPPSRRGLFAKNVRSPRR